MPKKVVFDWDGVFTDQTEYLCSLLRMPVPDRYESMQAHNINKQQARALRNLYSDMGRHEAIPFNDGFEDVFNLEPIPYVYTGTMNSGMRAYKEVLVHRKFPWFPSSHLIVVDGREKPPLDFADIVVEDGPHYLDQYGDHVVKILVDHFYNRSYKGPYIRVPSLRAAIDYVKELTKDET